MIIKEIRDLISEYNEEAIVFDNPSFDKSIVGITTDGHIVYDYNKMIAELMDDDKMSAMDAVEFIDYNTIRAIPYAGEYAPIILDSSFFEELEYLRGNR